MLTVQIVFPLHTLPTDEDRLTYGALVVRVLRDTVGDPSALLSGEAEWVTGETVPVAMAATFDPNLSRLDDMVTGLTILAAMYGQPIVAASVANVEFIGPDAAFYVSLSSSGLPSEEDTARAADLDADLDAWDDTDADLDALARDLDAFYGDTADDTPFADDDEARAFILAMFGEVPVVEDDAADTEPQQPETD
jgi:hypothetical protein